MLKKILIVTLPLLVFSSPLLAASPQTATYQISAQVNPNCTISVADKVLPNYDPLVTNANNPIQDSTAITLACTKGTVANITMQPTGTSTTGTGTLKGTNPNTDVLNYSLFKPSSNAANASCSYTAPWGTTSPLSTVAAPSKTARIFNVCIQVPANQDVSPDTYTDTITASASF